MKNRTFGERLAQARRILSVQEWRDVSQEEVGRLIDKSGPTISRYESGAAEAPKVTQIALESLLPFPEASPPPAQTEERPRAPYATHAFRKASDANPNKAGQRKKGGER